MTKDEALRRIAENDCVCTILRETGMAVPGADCREKWPAQPSEWCVVCIAKAALEDDE